MRSTTIDSILCALYGSDAPSLTADLLPFIRLSIHSYTHTMNHDIYVAATQFTTSFAHTAVSDVTRDAISG